MTFSLMLLSGLFHLVPGNAEIVCQCTTSSGNMGLYGVYMDVINKRNFVYGSLFLGFVSLFTPFKLLRAFSCGLVLFSLFLYFSVIKKWYQYLI